MNILRSIYNYANIVTNKLAGYGVNGRDLNVYPDDLFIVGYPKSGNTWLDFLIACLRAEKPEAVDFGSVETLVADIYVNDPRALHKLAKPRFLKSHEPYDARYPRVVYIVRDPRAVAVSYYHHLLGIGQISTDFSLEEFVPDFIKGSYDNFGSWHAHVRGWMRAQEQSPNRVMIVRYEDLKASTQLTLSNIASHLHLDPSPERIQAAISWSSPENMRRLELEGRKLGHSGLENFKEGSFFIRKTSSQGWKQELNTALAAQIEETWADAMRELGYAGEA